MFIPNADLRRSLTRLTNITENLYELLNIVRFRIIYYQINVLYECTYRLITSLSITHLPNVQLIATFVRKIRCVHFAKYHATTIKRGVKTSILM